MGSPVWVVVTLLVSIVLIVLTINKTEVSPVPCCCWRELFRRRDDGRMSPLDMVNAIESGIGGTLGFWQQSSAWVPFWVR